MMSLVCDFNTDQTQARAHGNEPSKGAKIDAQIADEEAEIIAKMDAKKANKN